MVKPPITLHFGIELDGDEPQFKIYDDSAAVWIEFTIPAGLYFYNHPESKKNIVSVINTLATGYMVLSRQNDRQLKFDFTAIADDFRLCDTNNDDAYKLADMLGLYDNSGNREYHKDVNVTDNWITQVTLCTWYAEGGRLANYRTERGFPAAAAIYTEAQSGKSAGVSTGRRRVIKNLKFTHIAADAIDPVDGIEHGTQTTIGTSENATWTTTIWQAHDPQYHASVFYASFDTWNEAEIEGEWYLTASLDDNCAQTNDGSTLIFDLFITASYVPIETQDKYLYFIPNSYIQTQNAAFDIIGDMSIILDIYPTTLISPSYWLLIGYTTGNIQQGFRYGGTIQWVQGSAAAGGYDVLSIFTPSLDTLYKLILTRTGSTGSNNLVVNVNGTDYTLTTTRAASTSTPYLMMMDADHFVLNGIGGYVKYLQLFDRVISAEEKNNAKLGINPPADTSVGTWEFNEQGGLRHLDTSGNGITLTSVGTTWAVIP